MASPPIPPQPFLLPFIFLKPEGEPLEKAGPDGPLPCPHWPRAQPSLDLSELRFPGLVVAWNWEGQMGECVEESYNLSSTGEADQCLQVWRTSLS